MANSLKEGEKFNHHKFREDVVKYLLARPNSYVKLSTLRNYCEPNNMSKEDKQKAMKIMLDLGYDKNTGFKICLHSFTSQHYKNLYTDEFSDYYVSLYYYQKKFSIKMEGSVLKFKHPQRGEAQYDMQTDRCYINGSPKPTLMAYFRGYSLGDVGGRFTNQFDSRELMFGDLTSSGCEFLSFVQQRIILHMHGLIKHRYKNLGSLLPYFKRFENMYHWHQEGFSIGCVSPVKPSEIPKSHRAVLKKNNCSISNGILYLASQDSEYVRNLIMLLENERIPNEEIKHRNNWTEILPSERLFELVKQYNYDMKATIRYIFNYIMPYEGMSIDKCLGQLRDYASMHYQMGVEKFKKYPKFLKSKHDIIKSEFDDFKIKHDEEVFKNKVNQELFLEKAKFIVEVPECTDDVRYEGRMLSHCVGSYIKRIITGQTQIMFLRQIKGVPQVTLEVRDNVLIQARGYEGRDITKEERKFIGQYASEKKLLVRV